MKTPSKSGRETPAQLSSSQELVLKALEYYGIRSEGVLSKMKGLQNFNDEVVVRKVQIDGKLILWVFPESHSVTIYEKYPWHYSIDFGTGEVSDDTDEVNAGVQRLKAMRTLRGPADTEEDDYFGGGWTV